MTHPVQSAPTAQRSQVSRLVDQCIPTFDDFWSAWPRREAKKAALRAWNKLSTAKQITAFQALPDHIAQWRKEGRARCHIPHPATWLNGERWEDELGGDVFPPVPKPKRQSGPPWWTSHVLMERKGREVGAGPARPGETTEQYKARIQAVLDENRHYET